MWLSPHGTLAYANPHAGDTKVNVYDVLTGTLAVTVERSATLAQLVFSPDDTRVATITEKGHIGVVEVGSGDVIATFEAGEADMMTFVAFAPDRDHLVVSSNVDQKGVLRTWNVATTARGADVTRADYSHAFGGSANGRWVCVQRSGSFLVRDMTSGRHVELGSEHELLSGHPCIVSNDGKPWRPVDSTRSASGTWTRRSRRSKRTATSTTPTNMRSQIMGSRCCSDPDRYGLGTSRTKEDGDFVQAASHSRDGGVRRGVRVRG
jgi:hypothetical protein